MIRRAKPRGRGHRPVKDRIVNEYNPQRHTDSMIKRALEISNNNLVKGRLLQSLRVNLLKYLQAISRYHELQIRMSEDAHLERFELEFTKKEFERSLLDAEEIIRNS